MTDYVAPTTNAEARDAMGLPAWTGCPHGDPHMCACGDEAAAEWWDAHPDLQDEWLNLHNALGRPDPDDDDAAYTLWLGDVDGWAGLTS